MSEELWTPNPTTMMSDDKPLQEPLPEEHVIHHAAYAASKHAEDSVAAGVAPDRAISEWCASHDLKVTCLAEEAVSHSEGARPALADAIDGSEQMDVLASLFIAAFQVGYRTRQIQAEGLEQMPRGPIQ